MVDNFEFDMDASIEKARQNLQNVAKQAEENAQRASSLRADVASIEETASSRGNEVSVTAKVGGTISAVRFSPAAMQLSPEQLGRMTQELIAQAQKQAMDTLTTRGSALFGEDSPITQQLQRDAAATGGQADGGVR